MEPQVDRVSDEEELSELRQDTVEGQDGPIDAQIDVLYSEDGKTYSILATAPENGGVDLSEEQVRHVLMQAGITTGILEPTLASLVANPHYGEPVVIARLPVDAYGSLAISEDGKSHFLLVSEPENGGALLTEEQIRTLLIADSVTEGILEDAIAAFLNHPVYNHPVVIAKQPINARMEFSLSKDKMVVSIVLRAPENGGAPVTEEQIMALLAEEQIVSGIKEKVISTMAAHPNYNLPYVVAKGLPAVDGEDGRIEDHFPRDRRPKPVVREDGGVDFKELGFIVNVMKDAAICTIRPPTVPVDGYTVLGETLTGKVGKPAFIPMGKNTETSPDGASLIALKNGNLIFDGARFKIEDVILINGNVDNSVGNIDFCGDITITGDVCEGYTVRSGGNVLINGTVEGADVHAVGDIVLSKGMNGMNKGILDAGRDIRCRFLENGNATAKGCIYAESIMNSNSSANDKIVVQGRRGIIVGGSCAALNSIEARAIGAASNVSTLVMLGATAETQNLQGKLSAELQELRRQLDFVIRDISYLERSQEKGAISEERTRILGGKRKDKTVLLLKSSGVSKQLDNVNKQLENMGSCRLSCAEIFPPTRVVFGRATYMVRTLEANRLFYYQDGEIKTGTSTGAGDRTDD